MDVQITKWGNSLGLRIPKAFVDALQLADGKKARLSLDAQNRLIIEPAERDIFEEFRNLAKGKSLAKLLETMTPYGPDETNDVAAVGAERLWDDE